MKYDVYGVGNSLVDIQARVSDDVLYEVGYNKGVMTLVDDETQKKVLGHLHGNSITRCAGGSAANTIMGIADFGGRVAYAGKTANDELGDFYLQDMRKQKVSIEVPPAAEGMTGTCVILITADAERTMLTSLGVSATISPDDINEDEIAQSKFVYIEGYLFAGDSTRKAAYKAIEYAQKHKVKIAFTVSDPFLIGLFRDEFWKLIEGPVDLLFCNLEEARSLTGKHDPIDCAQEIHRHAPFVAITLGGEGSLLIHEGTTTPVSGCAVKAIDTTGAGDMYAAGILYGITNGLNWQQSGRLASYASAQIVSQLGARLPRPYTSEEVHQILQG
jgi:hypothetical protein